MTAWQNPWRVMLAVNVAVVIGVFWHKVLLDGVIPGTQAPARGAPLSDLVGLSIAFAIAGLVLLAVCVAHRRGRISWLQRIAEWREEFPLKYSNRGEHYKPQKLMETLQAVTAGEDVIFTTGVGQHQMWAMQYLGCDRPRTFITSGGLGTMGFGASPGSAKTGSGSRFDVEDLASVFMRLDDGGTLLVEASWAAHRTAGDEFGITLFGTKGGADLRVTDMEPIGTLKLFTEEAGVAAETVLSPPAGSGHDAVVPFRPASFGR